MLLTSVGTFGRRPCAKKGKLAASEDGAASFLCGNRQLCGNFAAALLKNTLP